MVITPTTRQKVDLPFACLVAYFEATELIIYQNDFKQIKNDRKILGAKMVEPKWLSPQNIGAKNESAKRRKTGQQKDRTP